MKEIDILKDLLQSKITSQMQYNENLIYIRNPELRQVFTQLRDDEMRGVVNLQQMIQRMEAQSPIIAKIFPTRATY